MKKTNQIEINFDGGLIDQFPSFNDCVRASVYGCGRAFKSIAADMDMSASELSRKLAENPNDPVNFPLKLLPLLITATGDKRPVYWLIEMFIEDQETKRRRAIEEVAAMLPALQKLVRAVS